MSDTAVIFKKEIREKACRIFGSEENYYFFRDINAPEERAPNAAR